MTADQLASELLGPDPDRRLEAADRLSTMTDSVLPATAALVEACADPALRDLCVGALEELEEPPAAALPRLAELLRHADETVVYWAATLLGRAGAAAAAHAGALEQLSKDSGVADHVRDRAGKALAKVAGN